MGGRFRGLCLMTGLKVVMVTSEASAETSISNQTLGGMSWGGSDWALRGGTPREIINPHPHPRSNLQVSNLGAVSLEGGVAGVT